MITSSPDGTLVDVWVVPGASRDEVVGAHGDAIKVRTSAPPEAGKANKKVAALLRASTGAQTAAVVSGHSSRRKRVVLGGVSPGQVAAAFAIEPTSDLPR